MDGECACATAGLREPEHHNITRKNTVLTAEDTSLLLLASASNCRSPLGKKDAADTVIKAGRD